MKLFKNNPGSLKNIDQLFFLIITMITLGGCSKDDGPNEQLPENPGSIESTIYGKWKVLSGNLSFGQSKFVHFNEDDTIHLLEEDNQGFRTDLVSVINIVKDSINILKAEQGRRSIGYKLEGDKLTLTQEFGSNVKLERSADIPNADEWIKALTILDKGDMPRGRVDITFDGEHILRYNESERKIQKIDPHSFEITGLLMVI